MKVLGLDIGGANIKSADLDGRCRTFAFAMWRQCHELTDRLKESFHDVRPDLLGLTMTAELADCFASRADGVNQIVRQVTDAFPRTQVRVWLTSGEFAEPHDAVDLPELVAAANWHALATWVGRAVPIGPAILVDTGTTTTDIIPLIDGRPAPVGLTDRRRLESGELIYTGAGRTPLCAVLPSVQLEGTSVGVAAELFATAGDVHVLLGNLPEQPDSRDTADGRPMTRSHCHSRIARMLCCDREDLEDDTILDMARQFADAQVSRISAGLRRVSDRLTVALQSMGRSGAALSPRIITSGSGSFLAKAAAQRIDLNDQYDLSEAGHAGVSEAACAFAIAHLVQERCHDDLLETSKF